MSNDTLVGTVNNDTLTGGFGNDTVYGGTGGDLIYGDFVTNPGSPTPDFSTTGGLNGLVAPAVPVTATSVNISATGASNLDGDTYGLRSDALDLIVRYTGTGLRSGTLNIQDLGNGSPDDDIVRIDLSTFKGSFDINIGGNNNLNDTLILMGVTDVQWTGENAKTITYLGSDGQSYTVVIDTGLINVQTYGAPQPLPTFNDQIYGGDGIDTVFGGYGSDQIYGDAGDDVLIGGVGSDTIYGGADNDVIHGDTTAALGSMRPDPFESYNDVIFGGTGADTVYGGFGDDLLRGDDGNDLIYGGIGSDTIEGGAGADILRSDDGTGTGAPPAAISMPGGRTGHTPPPPAAGYFTANINVTGNIAVDGDTFDPTRTQSIEVVVEYTGSAPRTGTLTIQDFGAGADSDTVRVDLSTFLGNFYVAVGGNVGANDKLMFVHVLQSDITAPNQQTIKYIGADGNTYTVVVDHGTMQIETYGLPTIEQTYGDVISGGADNDSIYGVWGNDVLSGDDGDDMVVGLAGADTIFGGVGADVVYGDVIAAPGTDTAYPNISYNDVISGGAGNDTLYGGLGNESIQGDADADLTYGGIGADTVFGGTGADVLYGDIGALQGTLPILPGPNGGLNGNTAPPPAASAFTAYVTTTGAVVVDGDTYGTRAELEEVIIQYSGTAPRTGILTIQDFGTGVADPDIVRVDLTTFNGNFAINVAGNMGSNDRLLIQGAGKVIQTEPNQQMITYFGADGNSYTAVVNYGSMQIETYGAPTPTTTYDDALYGGDDNDTIYGEWGSDQLHGDAGADKLVGGQGQDTLYGGGSDDVIYGDFDANLSGTSPLAPTVPGTNINDTIAGSTVVIDLEVVTGDVKTNPAYVTFVHEGPTPLTELQIAKIGNGLNDTDTIRFDLRDFDDNFLITVKPEGVDDILLFEGVTGVTVVSPTEQLITYIGSDGLSHTVTVQHGQMQVQTYYNFNPIDFSGGGGPADPTASHDVIYGGDGNDTIDGGFGNDTIYGGADNDVIRASAGNDTIVGGTGTDVYTALSTTTLATQAIKVAVNAAGDGTVQKIGDATTDTITSIEMFTANEQTGQIDEITITGAVKKSGIDDKIIGLNDSAVGTFAPFSGGAAIAFGGMGQPTISQLLSGTYNPGSGPIEPIGTFRIASGDESGQIGDIGFTNFEIINFDVVCFVRGTHITTAGGEIKVEDLCLGDMVLTKDHGYQPIRWIGLAKRPAYGRLAPIRIKAGALGNSRDLWVSPQHKMLITDAMAELLFEQNEVLVPANFLVNDDTIRVMEGGFVEYLHIMFDDHEIIFAEDAPSESFFLGAQGWKSLDDPAQAELLELFPELMDKDFSAHDQTARRSLRKFEADVLMAKRKKSGEIARVFDHWF